METCANSVSSNGQMILKIDAYVASMDAISANLIKQCFSFSNIAKSCRKMLDHFPFSLYTKLN